jgi:hypothetical protein
MRVVGDSGIAFDLDDTVATSMVNSGHLTPVDPDEHQVPAELAGDVPPHGVDEDRLAGLEQRLSALENQAPGGEPADIVLSDGSAPQVGEDGIPVLDGEPPADGQQSGPVGDEEPETGPATAEAQDILHDTKPEAKRTRARKPATDES